MPNKWLIVNGLKYPAADAAGGKVEKVEKVEEFQKNPSTGKSKSSGKEYEEICEISLEQALEFQKWVKENKDL